MIYICNTILAIRYCFRCAVRVFVAALVILLSLGCVSQKAVVESLPPLYYPPPPDEPRFVYEHTLLGSSDVAEVDRTMRLRRMLTGESQSGRGFSKPFDVSVCQGRVYISDTVTRSVFLFDVPGRQFDEIGRDSPGLLRKPLGLATDENCNLYVADGTNSRVHVYSQSGLFMRSIGGNDAFVRLSHVAVDARGDRVYAVDTGGIDSTFHRVRVYDARSGDHLFDFGSRGTGPGEFNLPRDITVDIHGQVYVIDGGNFRVQVFDANGTWKQTFGSVGRRYGQFSRPKGIATDANGNVYVSDTAHGNFQIFDASGRLLLFIGERSERFERAHYMLPSGIDVDEDGRIYIVDQFFRKVDIFRPASLPESAGFLAERITESKTLNRPKTIY